MPFDSEFTVDADFPGGNLILDEIDGDAVRLHQDLRDTEGDWFFWHFRARGAAGRSLTFVFTGSPVLGTHGPAISTDGGATYNYAPGGVVEAGRSFKHDFAPCEGEVYFCFAIPYLERHMEPFFAEYADSPFLRREILCTTRKGRANERLHLGKLDGEPTYRVLLTSRHHCCESIATYCVEGFMRAVLADDAIGQWFREQVELLVVPFVDKDGVEDGDQGKNRKPRDHGRDYADESIYPTCAAIREFVPQWSAGKLRTAMDVHCPWIRGEFNEFVYAVGHPEPEMWEQQVAYSTLLEAACSGELKHYSRNNLPFGQAWNKPGNYSAGKGAGRWAAGQPGVQLATSLEIPYASATGVQVTAENARHLGGDMARALQAYLISCQSRP